MTVKQFVTDELQVPVTLAGNQWIVEAIEIVLDTGDYRFNQRLSEITRKSVRQLEKPMRDAKNKSLEYMTSATRQKIFGSKINPTLMEYVLLSAQYYRRLYES